MSNITPIDQLKQVISSEQMKAQVKAALPAHVSVDKFNRVMMTSLSNNPELVKAEKNSLFGSMLKAAADGLLPDGREAAIVMYGDKAQYQPMYAGILKKMRNSGELKSIQTQIIYEKDKFRYFFNETGEHLEFEPNMFSDRGEAIGVFSLGLTKDGGQYIDVMTAKEVEAVKASSKSAKSNYSPWNGAFKLEMWKKTSVRRISKKMPSSTDLDQVFASDNDDYEFDSTQKTPEPEKSPSVQNSPKAETRMEKIVKSSAKTKVVENEAASVGTPKNEKSPEIIEAETEILNDDEMPI